VNGTQKMAKPVLRNNKHLRKDCSMLRFNTLATSLTLATTALVMSTNQEAKPSTPRLPSGHPAVSTHPEAKVPTQSKPEDVQAVGAVIDAYYASISGPKGQPRDWERFSSLFMPDARFILPRVVDGKVVPMSLSPQEFIDMNRKYFERGGYYETDIHRDIDAFGHIAQVFSTYESRRALTEPLPYSRGINSFQLLNTGDRWWITTIIWDTEQPDTNLIPLVYLPSDGNMKTP